MGAVTRSLGNRLLKADPRHRIGEKTPLELRDDAAVSCETEYKIAPSETLSRFFGKGKEKFLSSIWHYFC